MKFEEKPIPSGIEICQIQLFHLANRIKDVEVDHEIDKYLPAIEEVLKDIPKEELIKKMVSVEFNRFINYYKKSNDISSDGGTRRNSGEIPTEGAVRYFINIGSRDNFDWMSLKDFLKDTLDLGRDDVFKVDVKEGFSFFNTDASLTPKVMEILNSFSLEGRRINVEISKNEGGGSSNRRDHNGRGGRSGGGFRGNRDSRGGGDRRSSGGNERRSGDRKFEVKKSGDGGERRGRRNEGGESSGFFEKAKRSRRS